MTKIPEQCGSCGGCCGKTCKTKNFYPHNHAGQLMEYAETKLRQSVFEGLLTGRRARQALDDADLLFNMRLKWK